MLELRGVHQTHLGSNNPVSSDKKTLHELNTIANYARKQKTPALHPYAFELGRINLNVLTFSLLVTERSVVHIHLEATDGPPPYSAAVDLVVQSDYVDSKSLIPPESTKEIKRATDQYTYTSYFILNFK